MSGTSSTISTACRLTDNTLPYLHRGQVFRDYARNLRRERRNVDRAEIERRDPSERGAWIAILFFYSSFFLFFFSTPERRRSEAARASATRFVHMESNYRNAPRIQIDTNIGRVTVFFFFLSYGSFAE